VTVAESDAGLTVAASRGAQVDESGNRPGPALIPGRALSRVS